MLPGGARRPICPFHQVKRVLRIYSSHQVKSVEECGWSAQLFIPPSEMCWSVGGHLPMMKAMANELLERSQLLNEESINRSNTASPSALASQVPSARGYAALRVSTRSASAQRGVSFHLSGNRCDSHPTRSLKPSLPLLLSGRTPPMNRSIPGWSTFTR